MNLFDPIPTSDPSVHPTDVPRLTGQNATVLRLLRQGPVTIHTVRDLGITRLAARIGDLKRAGHRVAVRRVGVVAEYRLEHT